MGGLLARAALRAPLAQVTRVITLATPHLGTLAPVQALRGTYPTVRRLAALDQIHSAELLSQTVFSGYPSLYGMLPGPAVTNPLNLFDASNWPQRGPRPDATLLRAAAGLHPSLHAGDARFHCIAGTGQRSATGVRLRADDFEYDISSDGDGTVPAVCATLPGCENYFLGCEHSDMPRSAAVAEAVGELVQAGRTTRLTRSFAPSADAHVIVSDQLLRDTYVDKIDWKSLGADERRRYLNQLNLAPPHYAAPITPKLTLS
jgi:hypothetical protein